MVTKSGGVVGSLVVESLRVWSPSQEVYLALLFVVESLKVWSQSQEV